MKPDEYRSLTPSEVDDLERQGCSAESWSRVLVSQGFDASKLERVTFRGDNRLGTFSGMTEFPGGLRLPSGIYDACLFNCVVGNEVYISGPGELIANYHIGDHAVITHADMVVYEGQTTFGNGFRISVLNEAGGREVPMFDRLSAQLAYILALYRHRPDVIGQLTEMIDRYAGSCDKGYGEIGEGARITHTHLIRNVKVGPYAVIEGATRLEEGSINSCAADPVYVGPGVNAREFIIASGSRVTDSVFLDKCFVGQGVELGKQYSAENSLFFANCAGFHGEACSVFAGPFTVTHHKSTLLIAAYFSFLNAGSGSNQSNHMYKLGPIHQGIVERGSKTTSDSYLLWPSKIGPFTLVMGRHYKNSDTSNLPFSYLVESNDESILSPGVNLKSVGTIRDAQKWPKRDRRKDPDLLDVINYNLLSPFTIQKMWRGREILQSLQKTSGQKSEFYTFENTRIPKNALERGISLYTIGIRKFLGNSIISRIEKGDCSTTEKLRQTLRKGSESGTGNWIDMAGLIAPQELVEQLLDRIGTGVMGEIRQVEEQFRQWHHDYYEMEWTWAHELIEKEFGCSLDTISSEEVKSIVMIWRKSVVDLDEMLYEDARKEFRISAQTGFGTDGGEAERSKDFGEVRGDFEQNPAVNAIREHIKTKSALAERILSKLP
jgi:acetyltransferase-like isoleucine patch superfamily enzyme